MENKTLMPSEATQAKTDQEIEEVSAEELDNVLGGASFSLIDLRSARYSLDTRLLAPQTTLRLPTRAIFASNVDWQ